MSGPPSLLAILVHEVRSPVAALTAVAAAFESESEPGARRDLARLSAAACRAIERLIADAAPGSVSVERLDVGRLVREAVAAAALAGSRISVRVDQSVPVVEADPVRLRQALDNLLSNAAKYGDGSEILVEVAAFDGELGLSVSDSGPGIPVAEQARIFEAGTQLRTSAPGSGLGLAVARAIAEAHGGTLTVRSASGEGATFTITLPDAVARSDTP